MAHITVRPYQSKTGLKWTATEAVWDESEKKYKEKKIEPIALTALGFSDFMTPTEAKAHAKKLNAMNTVNRKAQASKVKAAERLTDLITIENSIIPTEMSEAFVAYLEENWYGGEYNLRKQIQHWNLVQKMLTDLRLQPHEYFKKQKDFYKYFQKNGFSKSYVEKLLKVVNAWGEFYSEQSKTYFKKVPNPKGVILEAIRDASDADGAGADPLTMPTLARMKSHMPEGQWEYVRATLWLGLRPSELDAIIENPANLKVKMHGNTPVASIYQAKLISIPKEKRWKQIPLFHPEMKNALKDIQNEIVRKPLVKTLKKAAPNLPGIGLYSGRKGFTDLMLSLNQTLENIALWMGHASIERTWKSYKAKDVINFNEVKTPKVRAVR
ncbi:MAG: hypothetical protein ACXVCR_07395 [Bdellovibrio sp.]